MSAEGFHALCAVFYFISIVEVETRISRYLEVERPDAIKTIFEINLGDK